jgi:lipoyl(octanoyl) transferase
MGTGLAIENWGVGEYFLDYEKAWAKQRELHKRVVNGDSPPTLIFVEHESIFTAGSQTQPMDRPIDGSKVIDVDRGGRITWHGPGQLVGYPIIPLRERFNVVGFVRSLETAIIESCAEFGLDAIRIKGKSGVWVDAEPTRKVAAIGIRVASGVSMHGFAINCNNDLSWYDRIVPCGIPDAKVTTLSVETKRPITTSEMLKVVQDKLQISLADLVQTSSPIGSRV